MRPGSGLPDVLVVGGGPAGSTVAGLVARRGWAVEVVDRARFPRPKPCGECLNPGGVEALRRLGLLRPVLDLEPATLRGWRIRTREAGPAVGTFAPEAGAGLGIPRTELDHALLREAAARGARIVQGRTVEEVRPATNGRPPEVRLRDRHGETTTRSARLVVGADGLRSVTARSLDAHRRRPRLRKVSITVRLRGRGPSRGRGRLVLHDDLVLGLAPVHARRSLWNATVVAGASRYGGAVSDDPPGFLLGALERAPLRWDVGPDVLGGPWASGPFDWPVERAGGDRVLLVGDAAGYYDPLTGQGMYRALRSAEIAARTIDTTLKQRRFSDRMLEAYDRALRREFRPGRRIQRAVEAVVSRRGLRERAVSLLVGAPGSLSALIRVTGDAAPPSSLLRPGSWLELLRRP